MAHSITLTDIPADMKDQVLADFQGEGAQVLATEQRDGGWTVVALFADDPNSPLAAVFASATAAVRDRISARAPPDD